MYCECYVVFFDLFFVECVDDGVEVVGWYIECVLQVIDGGVYCQWVNLFVGFVV